MSASMQSRRHSRPYESYDLAQSARLRSSYRKEDELFDTLFPQPPPRSRILAERLARPSLPSLKTAAHNDSFKALAQNESADSSRSTAPMLSSSNSIESVNSLSSYPSSTSSLSLLHSIHPYKQGTADSSIDYYSPAVSDVNSAETDHSVTSSHAHTQSSDIDVGEQRGPLTPLTPNGASSAWRPKELNLVRKRQGAGSNEPSLPTWNATSAISGDRDALLVGLGLGGVGFNAPSSAPTAASGVPADKLMQTRAILASRSPQFSASHASPWDPSGSAITPSAATNLQGPKQLLLVSSGGPPAVRRFPGRRPSEGIHEAFTSQIQPPGSEQSSRCNTPQMRSAIPVMPSGPAFVDARALSPDPAAILQAERAGLSAEEFLAQIASTPEYQANKYFESNAFDAADEEIAEETMETNSSATASPGTDTLAAKAPGFSSTVRSRAASLSRRKAPPTPLILESSPATSNSSTLPGSAEARRRRSLTTTINQRSPLSASPSNFSNGDNLTPRKTPTLAASGSDDRQHDTESDYSEPLRTAFYDFDTEEEASVGEADSEPSSRLDDSPTAAQAPADSTFDSAHVVASSASEAQPVRSAVMERIMAESSDSQVSVFSNRVDSIKGDGSNRESSGSEPAAAFEFADLETESYSEGLSLQTMMGFLHRQDSQKVSSASRGVETESEQDDLAGTSQPTATPTLMQAPSVSQEASPESAITPKSNETRDSLPASAAPGVPSFNISIFEPGQTSHDNAAPSLQISDEPENIVEDLQRAEAQTSPKTPMGRSRKQSIVPAPPSFAIRDASSSKEKQSAGSSMLLPSIADGIEVRPVLVSTSSSDLPAGSSRWSSGSESEGEVAASVKDMGRKSFSVGRKSFSTNRKNSVAITRELATGPVVPKEALPEVGRQQSKRSSKTRLPGQIEQAQPMPAPTKPSGTSFSKRLRLNGLSNLRKKSSSNLNGQIATPSTPTSARGPLSAGPTFPDRSEFPFPPPALPQATRSSPNSSMQAMGRDESADLMIRTASASTFASGSHSRIDGPLPPLSAPSVTTSDGMSGPLTTQQILAQARSNVWPENFIGNSVSAAGMSSPYLSAAQDTFSYNFVPSRLAPTPPFSASASVPRAGWSSTPQTPPMLQAPLMANNTSPQDKSLPSTPIDEPSAMMRSRSRNGKVVAPPKNLRHMRKSSSNTTLDKARKEVRADVFKPSHASQASFSAAPSATPTNTIVASPQQDTAILAEEKLPFIAESNAATALADEEVDTPLKSFMISRQHAKMQKARRNRKQQDRFPRYNSWSDIGLQWLIEQGEEAFERLASELLPSSAILTAAGASADTSKRVATGGSGGSGDGDGDSDASDTDDYGSSDGGGGAGGGGFGGAGGAGGGKHPGQGHNDADNSDEEAEASDDDEEAEALTDEDSDEVYGATESKAGAASAGRAAMPVVPVRGASIATTNPAEPDEVDSDSSDDRPLGMLVDDPRALQKALRAQERKRHFALAQQALEGKGSSSATPSTGSRTRQTAPAPTTEAVVNPNDLAQRLEKVQVRRERAQAPSAVAMQRAQTVARPTERKLQVDPASVARSKSVRTTPAERYVHPGLRARTPSEAALRAKAMAQAMAHGPSPTSPTLGNVVMMPDLPANAMATVVAAQKAMAHAQANPSPAAMAQAQALASSATAALNAATAQVKRGTSSPISPSFNLGEPVGHVNTSPRIGDGAELPGARQRSDPRGLTLPVASSAGVNVPTPAVATPLQQGMFQRLRSRSVSRQQNPLTINTAAAPPMPDLPRPGTGSKDSQASSSPHSSHAATFASHAQASEPRQPHKVFILSRQRFTVVEVPVTARARDLALAVVEMERLPMDDSKGGWIVFDCSAQLGIERPLREYELITDVVNVRAHPQTDFFLIKRTELSPYLSIRSVPTSSPALAGYVYVQDRKKKWNKRWLELRDHGLYHAKNEKGKDEMPICQISSFDVYLVDSSTVKMPKANGFALRSQDPITMFEKPDQDYLHYFCLTDPAAHRDWVRAILNARTYMLRQEKAALFQIDSPSNSQDAGPALASGGLSRKNTSRRPNVRAPTSAAEPVTTSTAGPTQPTTLIDSSVFAGPFAKGSLLADKAINDAKEALRGHAVVAAPMSGRRRDEMLERQRRAKADGQPLIDLARK